MMRLSGLATVLIILVLATGPVWAHEGSHFVSGTVTATDLDRLVVRSTDGKTVSLTVTPDTRFQPSGETAAALPKVGDRVVVQFSDQKSGLQANEVRFSTVPAKSAP